MDTSLLEAVSDLANRSSSVERQSALNTAFIPEPHLPYVPYDVWLYLADFIPKDGWRTLLSVNKSFNDLAMDILYDNVRFSRHDGYEAMMSQLKGLKNPGNSKRVRRLDMEPSFMRIFRSGKKREILDSRSQAWPRRLWPLRKKSLTSRQERFIYDAYPEMVLRPMIDAIREMSNLNEYIVDIEWWHRAVMDNLAAPEAYSTMQLLAIPFTTCGSTLRKLSLKMSFDTLRPLISSAVGLEAIEELNLDLKWDGVIWQWEDQSYRETVIEALVPFINGFNRTLRHFSFLSEARLDLSEFFSLLDHFPRLRRFVLYIPFNNICLSNPSHLSSFITKHAQNLTHLAVMANLALDYPREDFIDEWVEASLTMIPLPALTTLELGAGLNVPPIVACMHKYGSTLTTLCLETPPLEQEDLTIVFDACSTSLLRLRVHSMHFHGRVIALLAKRFPLLEELDIVLPEADFGPDIPDRVKFVAAWFKVVVLDQMREQSVKSRLWKLYCSGTWEISTNGYACVWKWQEASTPEVYRQAIDADSKDAPENVSVLSTPTFLTRLAEYRGGLAVPRISARL